LGLPLALTKVDATILAIHLPGRLLEAHGEFHKAVRNSRSFGFNAKPTLPVSSHSVRWVA